MTAYSLEYMRLNVEAIYEWRCYAVTETEEELKEAEQEMLKAVEESESKQKIYGVRKTTWNVHTVEQLELILCPGL